MTYSLGAGLSLPYLMSVQFDVEKTPLALYYPMEEPGMATADFRYTLNYKWDDFVDFTTMLAYEEEFAAREFYGLDLMYPIFMSRDKGNYFRIKLLLIIKNV